MILKIGRPKGQLLLLLLLLDVLETNHQDHLSRLMRLCKDVTLTPYGFCDFGEKKTKKKTKKN